MPLAEDKIEEIMNYCKRDLPQSNDWYHGEFNFIGDSNFRDVLVKEFYSARYIYKLMEALNVKDYELHAHAKFQIIQYASIYEAVVNYLLNNLLDNESQVKELYYHKTYKPVSALAEPTKIYYDDQDLYLCLYKDVKTPPSSVKFADKIDVLVDLGIIEELYANDIKEIYQTRNSIHIETAIKRNTQYHIDLARKAYRRMRPFIDQIKDHLK